MDNVIYGLKDLLHPEIHYGPCDPVLHRIVLDLQFNEHTRAFRSAQDVATMTGLRLSVVTAILKRHRK